MWCDRWVPIFSQALFLAMFHCSESYIFPSAHWLSFAVSAFKTLTFSPWPVWLGWWERHPANGRVAGSGPSLDVREATRGRSSPSPLLFFKSTSLGTDFFF